MASAGKDKDLCHSVADENDVPAPSFPVNQLQMAGDKRSREGGHYSSNIRAYWSTVDEEVFISLMIKIVRAGKMASGRFSSETWNCIKNRLNETLGRSYSLSSLKGKYYRLKKSWQEFKTLLDFSPKFVWEPKSNKVMASEDAWTEYLQVHPRNKGFKKKGCTNYALLTKIFGDRTGFAKSSAEARSLYDGEEISGRSPEDGSGTDSDSLYDLMMLYQLHLLTSKL